MLVKLCHQNKGCHKIFQSPEPFTSKVQTPQEREGRCTVLNLSSKEIVLWCSIYCSQHEVRMTRHMLLSSSTPPRTVMMVLWCMSDIISDCVCTVYASVCSWSPKRNTSHTLSNTIRALTRQSTEIRPVSVSQMLQKSNRWVEVFRMSDLTVIQCQQAHRAAGLRRVKFIWPASGPAAVDGVSVSWPHIIYLLIPTAMLSASASSTLCKIKVWNSGDWSKKCNLNIQETRVWNT